MLVDAPSSFEALAQDVRIRIAVADPKLTVLGQKTDELLRAVGRAETWKGRLDVATDARGVLDHLMNGKLAASIKYGEAKASICSSDSFQNEAFTVAGKPSPSFAAGDFWCVPALSSAAVWYGDYPGNIIGGDNSQGTSELNVLDFLAAFNGRHVDVDGHLLTFNTVLTAIEKAGMHDQFAKSGPYFFFAPSDEVFAALPADQRNALLNDPQALAQQLKAHLIEGYYPYGSLSGATYGQADRELTNLLGQKLSLLDSAINGQDETGPNFTIGNGNRLQIIYELLPVK